MRDDTFPVNNHYAAGLLPFLYVCDSLLGGIAAVAVIAFVFVAAMLTVHCLRALIPYTDKYLFFTVIGAAWVSIVALLLEAWLQPVGQNLGRYLFIIPMNTTLLCCLDDCIHKEYAGFVKPACLFSLGGVLVGALRELLGQGIGMTLFSHSAGALLLAGALLALANCLFSEADKEGVTQ
ncbi:MAG: Rnf-Nqr domain containing protein [Gammaproteobacteria bacterium]